GFARDTWEDRTSRGIASRPWPTNGASDDGRLSCDAAGCLYRAQGRLIALARHPAALPEDCAAADAVVATIPVRKSCAAKLVIDRFDMWREGAHALWIEEDRIRVESVTDHQGARPWTRRRGKPDED
ncbi:MAG: ComEC family competence protein, partial [Alphaproteobacteria bacterium]|nr:ComEC family competence protein [Alphaproteobacteria bacterium]